MPLWSIVPRNSLPLRIAAPSRPSFDSRTVVLVVRQHDGELDLVGDAIADGQAQSLDIHVPVGPQRVVGVGDGIGLHAPIPLVVVEREGPLTLAQRLAVDQVEQALLSARRSGGLSVFGERHTGRHQSTQTGRDHQRDERSFRELGNHVVSSGFPAADGRPSFIRLQVDRGEGPHEYTGNGGSLDFIVAPNLLISSGFSYADATSAALRIKRVRWDRWHPCPLPWPLKLRLPNLDYAAARRRILERLK